MHIEREDIDRLVLQTVADAAAIDASLLRPSTPLLETHMDSLTLVSIVTRLEATYGVAFDPAELVEVLRARSVGDIAVITARKLHAS
jgi:acyl carrier protein